MDITGRTAFAQEASQINENLFSFRSDIDSIRSANQQLLQESKTASAAEVLKSVGQEVGVRTFNELLEKYGGKAYRYKTSLFGNRSLKDLDAKLGENIIDATAEARDVVGKGLSNFKNRIGLPTSYDLNDEVISLKDMGIGYDGLEQNSHSVLSGLGEDSITPEMSRTVSESMMTNPETVVSDESFTTFMNNRIQELPRTESGAIDFEADQMNFQDRMNAQQRDLPEDMGEGIGHHTRAEIGGEDALSGEARSDLEAQSRYSDSLADAADTPKPKSLREQVEDEITGGRGAELEAEIPSMGEGLGEGVGEGVLEGVGEGFGMLGLDTIAEGAAKEGGEVVGKELAGTALEGVGVALDATGIFAPLGALFGAAGTALDVAGLYQVGKGVVDWVDEDILQKPMPSAPQLQLPSQPFTISQRGMGIVPNMDSLNLPSSVSSGW
jgi:hypothetical protein